MTASRETDSKRLLNDQGGQNYLLAVHAIRDCLGGFRACFLRFYVYGSLAGRESRSNCERRRLGSHGIRNISFWQTVQVPNSAVFLAPVCEIENRLSLDAARYGGRAIGKTVARSRPARTKATRRDGASCANGIFRRHEYRCPEVSGLSIILNRKCIHTKCNLDATGHAWVDCLGFDRIGQFCRLGGVVGLCAVNDTWATFWCAD